MTSSLIGRLMANLRRGLGAAPSPRIVRAAVQRLSRYAGAFSPAEIQVLHQLPRQRVFVLAPHPDDEVIGAGGMLAHSLDNASQTTVVYMTDGGGLAEDREALILRRRNEAEALSKRFPIDQVFWDHPDTGLDPSAASGGLIDLLEELRPDVIYLPSFFEHHYDHYAANALLCGALAKLDLVPSIAGYEVWDNLPSPTVVVDISQQIDRKREMMRFYETPMEITDFVQLIENRGALHYLLHVDSRRRSPVGYAEAFYQYDCKTYQRQFEHWDALLREQNSPMTTHLDRLRAS